MDTTIAVFFNNYSQEMLSKLAARYLGLDGIRSGLFVFLLNNH